jgi:hypothetical protein
VPLSARPVWADEQLEDDRQTAISIFRDERLKESLEDYLQAFEEAQASTENLLETTVDLTQFDEALEILTNSGLLDSFRYLAGPPISIDDLKVLADSKSLSHKTLQQQPEQVARLIDTVMAGLDRRRFAWITEGREPTQYERSAAVLATAAVMAAQRVGTLRRTEGSQQQEESVRRALIESGFRQVARRNVTTLSQAPNVGEFCDEALVGSRKADIIIRLWDGRLMPTECKVSNSEVNSIKRLNGDAALKAGIWLQEFGTRQVVPAAVISGVFKLAHLSSAQEAGLSLFWAHSLPRMTEWIQSTKAQ